MKEIRTLRADEIECRIGQISKDGKGLSLLLYKDARCDMNILDETFGPMNWQRRHSRDNANCIVSIWDEDKKQWVEKEDTGTESNTEAEKGLASDSFKRACVNVGIGRELYTSPFIWIPADKCNISGNRCYDKFDVRHIAYDDKRCVSELEIVNEKTGETVYSFPKAVKKAVRKAKEEAPPVEPEPPQDEDEQYYCRDCGETLTWVRTKDGGQMAPIDIRNLSYQKVGRVLCPTCLKAAMKAGA